MAYNTCQSCAGSPNAYFVYQDGVLTCQNCGNQFGLDTIGANVGGCNPQPVADYSVEDSTIIVPTSELKDVVSEFENWKG